MEITYSGICGCASCEASMFGYFPWGEKMSPAGPVNTGTVPVCGCSTSTNQSDEEIEWMLDIHIPTFHNTSWNVHKETAYREAYP